MSNNSTTRGAYIRRAAGLTRSPTSPVGAPVSFTAESPPLAAGTSAVFDTDALHPTYRQPYYIDEIRFRFVDTRQSFLQQSATHYGPIMKFLFQTGQEKISKAHVPAWLYCPKLRPYEGYQDNTEDGLRTVSFCRWLLPSPMWMAPGDVLQASVERDAVLGANVAPVVSRITYIGRTLPPGTPPPAQRIVPWVSYMELRRDDASPLLNEDFAIANEQFRNPFLTPLDVQRLTVRGTVTQFDSYGELQSGHISHAGAFDGSAIEMSLIDSSGYVVVPTDVFIGNAIEADRRAWTFDRNIGPREALHPKITYRRTSLPDEGGITSVQVGLISSRKVMV